MNEMRRRSITMVPDVVGGGFSLFGPSLEGVEDGFHGTIGRFLSRSVLDVRMRLRWRWRWL